MKLGSAIRKSRKQARITQAQLAVEIGCTEGYVAHIERGRSLPSEHKLLQICEVLKLDKRQMIHLRQKEKASAEARQFYDEPAPETLFFREGRGLTPEQVIYAVKVIRAVESNEKVRTAIDLIIGED